MGSEGDEMSKDRQQTIQVLKRGETVYIRSFFSPGQDVLIKTGKGRNGQINFVDTKLVSAGKPMELVIDGKDNMIHQCGDDSTPWNLNGTYIGANHGCSDGQELTIRNHGLSAADIGAELTDETGNKSYIVKIVNSNCIWVLPENKSKNDIWDFNPRVKGNTFKIGAGGRVLKADKIAMAQIVPSCRIKQQKYLVNAEKPLEEGKVTSCDFLDMAEEYDIISPASLLAMILKNPGKEPDFTDKKLDAVISNRIIYRFLPMGACTVEHKSRVNQPINLGYMGFVQTARLNKGNYALHEYYIPKTLKFETKGSGFDFKSIQDFTVKLPGPLNFNSKEQNIQDEKNLPDRFIQFLAEKENEKPVRKVGYVLGYSLIDGITRPEERAGNTSNALMIYTSYKTYPSAINSKMGAIKAGTEFHCLAYRQYFDPSAYENATSVYWHREGNAYVLYIDYHKSAGKDVIKLPDYLSGKKITVVEKNPSVKLFTDHTVPPEGIVLSVSDPYGYAILKLEEKID
jgi:hypothetical protein